jgi:hypothetical protein
MADATRSSYELWLRPVSRIVIAALCRTLRWPFRNLIPLCVDDTLANCRVLSESDTRVPLCRVENRFLGKDGAVQSSGLK